MTILGDATLTAAVMDGRRMQRLELATRHGNVSVAATGFVEASGDAALCREAGLPTREPEASIYGSMNFLIENYDLETVKQRSMPAVAERLRAEGADHGLVRHEGAAHSGGVILDLRYIGMLGDDAWFDVVLGGALKDRGMISFASALSRAQTEAMRHYVVARASEDAAPR